MNSQVALWILCFIGIVACSMFQNIQTESIGRAVNMGQFTNIARGVTISDFAEIGSFVSIAPNTMIHEHSNVGSFSHIGSMCDIGNWVDIQQYTNIGNGNNIGSGSQLRNYCSIGNTVTIGNRVKLDQYSSVADFANIGDNCILAMFSSVGHNVKVQPSAYVGMYSSVGSNSIIGSSAVILRHVQIPNAANVKPNQVVLRMPSSFELYQKCNPAISDEQSRSAGNPMNGSISPEFNDMMRHLIDAELNTLVSNCNQNTPTKPTFLPQIIALYLMQFHGLQRFKENLQQVKQMCNTMSRGGQSIVIINGVRMGSPQPNSMIPQLQNEYHFGENPTRNVLESDVRGKLMELMAIDQDAERDNDNRAEGDSYCRMIGQIRNGDREITCAPPNIQTQYTATNYC